MTSRVKTRSHGGRAGGDERGATLVLFALLIVLILLFAALVVDLANGRQEKRHVQNGVDAASLGAAKLYDGTTSDGTGTNAIAAKRLALQLLKGNKLSVPITATAANTYACTGNDSCTVRFSWSNANANRLCVTVELTDYRVPTYFAGAIDTKNLYASARGNGCRRRVARPADQTPAFFSRADTCDPVKAFNLSGSNVTVVGALHSNEDMVISGSNDSFDGATTYRTDFINSGSANTFNPAPVQDTTFNQFPVTFDIADYRAGGVRALAAGSFYRNAGSNKLTRAYLESRNWLSGNVLKKGLYYTSDEMDLDLSGVTHETGGVTFVAEKKAVFKWPGGNAASYEPSGLFIFADNMKVSPLSHKDNCAPEGLIVSGQNFRWDGIMYVPRGGADISASDVATPIRGSILAHALLVQGQNFALIANPVLFPSLIEEVFLDE